MANSRPKSMIIPPNVFDETNITKKRSTMIDDNSSTSSVDSRSGKNESNTSAQARLLTTTSSTTTDSDFESEQDDNPNSPHRQKNDIITQDQLSKRTRHFHKLFKSEINADMPDLIDSYVCAYQGDILLQGKMYITNRYLCFHSRIINYVTKHVYRWEEIKYVTKERVAFIFPTAIGIQLKQTGKKVTYASFLTRDQAYDKIYSVWSRFTNETNSFNDDDDDNELNQEGTLKATNHNDKNRYSKRHSYEIIDAPEHDDEVLQMYLRQNNNDQRINSVSSKSSEEKKPPKTSQKKKSNENFNHEQKLTNKINENTLHPNPTTRHSRYTKNEQKQNDSTKRNSSLVNHQSPNTSLKSQQSRSCDRTTASVHQKLSHSNPSLTTISNPTPNDNGILVKIINTILSLLKLVIETILSLIQRFQAYPIKLTIIVLLFLTILFFHSFYLIKLANRIEYRLQTLHYSPPSSLIRNSFSSNSKEL